MPDLRIVMKHFLSILIFNLLLSSHVFAQLGGGIMYVTQYTTSSYNGKSYIYSTGVTLSPGFRVTSGNRFIITPNIAQKESTPATIAASMDKNFTREETILVGNITSETQIGGLDASQKLTTISYLDESGRSLQEVAVEASPSGKDVIKPFAYDGNGRMPLQYQAYTNDGGTTNTGWFRSTALVDQSSFYTNSNTIASDSRPYTEIEYELSPLNRIKQVYGAGILWKNGTTSKSTKSIDQINQANSVRKWTLNGSNLPTTSGYYPAGTLFYTTTTDEDNNVSRKYVDGRGNVVMTDDNGMISYYVYDLMGRLRFILPPELCNDYLPETLNITIDQTMLNIWAFQYIYDVRGRVSEKKGPGPDNDWTYYVYDQWDRVVLTQDGVQRAKSPKEWTFVKYDELNRPVMTGVITTIASADHPSMIAEVTGGRFESRNTSSQGYTTSNSFPTTSSKISSVSVLAITYYDDYNFLNNAGWSESNSYYQADAGVAKLAVVKGRITGTRVKILDQNEWLCSVNYYNKYYQTVETISENHLTIVPDRIINTYNFAGWLTQTKRTHNNAFPSGTTTIILDYDYDNAGRLKNLYHQINGNKILLASYGYNELGQLIEKNLHSTDQGNTFLQSIDYRYNIRGWVTSINNSSLTNDGMKNNDSNDLFGMELIYNQETISVAGTNTNPKYNGTITAARWKANDLTSSPVERIYAYDYNTKNWITKGRYASKNGTSWTGESGMYSLENIQYDANGNIQALKRSGESNGIKVTIDDLNYVYGTNGNQLTAVEDNAGTFASFGYPNKVQGLPTELTYDKNGNLNADLNAEIVSVSYNYLNLPSSVTIDLASTTDDYLLEFNYDATGYLLKRTIKKGGVVMSTIDYVNGIQYFNGKLAIVFTPEGRATPYNNTFEYEYFIKDHLTNTRVVFGKLHDTDVYVATMESELASKEQNGYGFKNLGTRTPANNHTKATMDTPTPDESAKVNGFTGSNPVGPAKMIQVNAGDKISLEVYAKVNAGTSSGSLVSNFTAAVLSAFGIVNSGETQLAYQALNSALPIYSSQVARNTNSPKAYLFYIIFDNNYTFKQFGYASVDAAAQLQHQKLQLDVTIPSNGFIYTYVANESNVSNATAAYFDDFRIVHEKNTTGLHVTEVNDYDPFGFLLEGTHYFDDTRLANNYRYQGDYAEFEELLGWTRFSGRGNYDARLGRWHSVDPASQYSSPYLAMNNSPTSYIDQDGSFAWFLPAIVGAVVGGVTGGIIANQNGEDWWKGAITGSIVGAGLGMGASSLLGTGSELGGSAYKIVTNGLTWGNMSIASNLVQGRGLEGAWKGGLTGFFSGSIGTATNELFPSSISSHVSGTLYGTFDRIVRGRELGYTGKHLFSTALFGFAEGFTTSYVLSNALDDATILKKNLAVSSITSVPGLGLSLTGDLLKFGLDFALPLSIGVGLLNVMTIKNDVLQFGIPAIATVGSYFLIQYLSKGMMDEYENYYPKTFTVGQILNQFR